MSQHVFCHCCPQTSAQNNIESSAMARRAFLASMTAGGALLANVSWGMLAADPIDTDPVIASSPKRKPLVVVPILVHDLPQRREAASWRNWGGIATQEDAAKEVVQITQELDEIQKSADFPVEFLPVIAVTDIQQAKGNAAVADADLILLYGAGWAINGVQNFGKDVIIFQRWRSGPVYLQYEVVSPRFLRQHTDEPALDNIRCQDVVTDNLEELTWRLRSLCGLKNSRNQRILCVGGPGAWAQSAQQCEELFATLRKQWNIDLQTVSYDHLGKILDDAQKDERIVRWAEKRAEEYLKIPGTTLNTKKEFVSNNFILEYIFSRLMQQSDCHAITVSGCMSVIIPQAKTTACLTLSLLNDNGYLAFCESDFAVIPSGILLANISGRPVFLNDPTYPHDQIVTLAHCTSPRRMDGKNFEPAQIVTHFESDYGAAPKVEFKMGQNGTVILPDFRSKRWAGFTAKVVDVPFRPICRSQVDVQYTIEDDLIAERMPGFHWMFSYGDYSKEIGYALRRVGIEWEDLDKKQF